MQVVVDSLLTTYLRIGAAESMDHSRSLVILHGWGDSSRGWRDFATKLGYDTIIVDLPGFGGSDWPPTAWGLDDYAAFVDHFLQKLGIEPYAVLGHSNGGAIAIRGLSNGTLRARKLILLASAGVRSTYKGRNKVLRLVAKTGKIIATSLPSAAKASLRRKLYATVGSDMLVVEHLQETFKKIVNDDVLADAAKISLPTLLIYGRQDTSTPPEFGRLLHDRITGSQLQVLESGHFVHHDQIEKTVKLVRGFLR